MSGLLISFGFLVDAPENLLVFPDVVIGTSLLVNPIAFKTAVW